MMLYVALDRTSKHYELVGRVRRLARILAGICLVYVGFAFALRADLGTGPFNVLQQGVASRLGVSIGHAGWLNGALFVVVALVLGQRPGMATVASVALGGFLLDAVLGHLGTPGWFGARTAMTMTGLTLMSGGGALYLSGDLGASPVDGLMTALHRRWRGAIPLFAVRTGMEMTALAVGWLAGGVVGVGTIVIGVGIGPGLHAFLRLLRPGFARGSPPVGEPTSDVAAHVMAMKRWSADHG